MQDFRSGESSYEKSDDRNLITENQARACACLWSCYVQNILNDMPTTKPLDAFVESWGTMGVLWGVNRSVARVHALLIASEEPLGLEEIADKLQISRGNASMSLKELRGWGVVKKVTLSGDRRDYFATEQDAWTMLFRIMSQRKSREFDPALESVRIALQAASPTKMSAQVRARLEQMESILTSLDVVLSRLLKSERAGKMMLQFLAGIDPK